MNILTILNTKENYSKYKELLKNIILPKELEYILKYIDIYYNTHDSIDWSSFREWFLIKNSASKDIELYDPILSKLENSEYSEADSEEILEELINRDVAIKIADHALSIGDGKETDFTPIKTLLSDRDSQLLSAGEEDELLVMEDVENLLDTIQSAGHLNWRMEELQKSCGPIGKGNLVLIGARPEVGKTTFLCSEASYMLQQLGADECILWFNNEQPGEEVKYRFYQSLLGWTNADMQSNWYNTLVEVKKLIGDPNRIKIIDKGNLNKGDVLKRLDKYKAGLIIFDQARKLKEFDRNERNDVQKLASIYSFLRTIAKTYAPVITVHQARGDASGVLYPEDNQLEGVQTEVQGELDVQIMIGKTFESGREYDRGINIVKNKLFGADPAYRHAKWEVKIEPEIARFTGTL